MNGTKQAEDRGAACTHARRAVVDHVSRNGAVPAAPGPAAQYMQRQQASRCWSIWPLRPCTHIPPRHTHISLSLPFLSPQGARPGGGAGGLAGHGGVRHQAGPHPLCCPHLRSSQGGEKWRTRGRRGGGGAGQGKVGVGRAGRGGAGRGGAAWGWSSFFSLKEGPAFSCHSPLRLASIAPLEPASRQLGPLCAPPACCPRGTPGSQHWAKELPAHATRGRARALRLTACSHILPETAFHSVQLGTSSFARCRPLRLLRLLCLQCQNAELALEMYETMKERGSVKPDVTIYGSLLAALRGPPANIGAARQVRGAALEQPKPQLGKPSLGTVHIGRCTAEGKGAALFGACPGCCTCRACCAAPAKHAAPLLCCAALRCVCRSGRPCAQPGWPPTPLPSLITWTSCWRRWVPPASCSLQG